MQLNIDMSPKEIERWSKQLTHKTRAPIPPAMNAAVKKVFPSHLRMISERTSTKTKHLRRIRGKIWRATPSLFYAAYPIRPHQFGAGAQTALRPSQKSAIATGSQRRRGGVRYKVNKRMHHATGGFPILPGRTRGGRTLKRVQYVARAGVDRLPLQPLLGAHVKSDEAEQRIVHKLVISEFVKNYNRVAGRL